MRYLWLAVLLLGLAACATKEPGAGAYPNETAEEIYTHGKTALNDKGYTEAIKRFEALEVQYPDSKKSELGVLDLIYAYYMKEEYALSIAAATRFIQIYTASPYVDYAYYLRGLAKYQQNLGFFEKVFALDLAKRDLTSLQEAYSDFLVVVRDYPESRYAPAAYQYLVYLKNLLANFELEVAQYYFDRHAYVAAAERASRVLKYFQGAPASYEALPLLASSYRALHEDRLARDVNRVIQYNHLQ